MKTNQSRSGNIIVITMFCLIVVMFIAAMVLDVGFVSVNDTLPETAAGPVTVVADVDRTESDRTESDRTESVTPIEPETLDLQSADGQPVQADIEIQADIEADIDQPIRSEDDQELTLATPDSAPATSDRDSVDSNAVRLVLDSLRRRSGLTGIWQTQPMESPVVNRPRDIVFVVDLSGSMNDDSEPAWATKSISDQLGTTDGEAIAESLVQQFYTDMKFGAYPGQLEYIGKPLGGIPENSGAYHQMTSNDGKLADPGIAAEYRIENSDSEATRKVKAYRWMIDHQIKRLMPQARPVPDSASSFEFWEKYLDYIMVVKFIGSPENKSQGRETRRKTHSGPVPGLGRNSIPSWLPYASLFPRRQPIGLFNGHGESAERGWIPPNVDSDRIYKFNNPDKRAFPNADANTRWQLRNKIGYRSYVQFLLDFGRDGKPDEQTYVQSSVNSPFCPFCEEEVNGESFVFPPRTQPMHGVRRSLIAALQAIRDRNFELGMTVHRDLVSILAFDQLENGVWLVQSLTDDYDAAMAQCQSLQATTDKGSTTATELGLRDAYRYLRPISAGGVGREQADKVLVLLTDGRPNAQISSNSEVEQFVSQHPDEKDFYGRGYFWLDAALMQCKVMQSKGWYIYPIGVGFGADHDFLDRIARIGSTAIDGGAIRNRGLAAELEQKLPSIFGKLTTSQPVSFSK